MFSDNTSEYLFLKITDEEGKELPALKYGLFKPQLFSNDQRYGYDLGPCYFNQYPRVEPNQLRRFLRENFPNNEYPINVKFRIRGFDSASGKIQDLEGPSEFSIDIRESVLNDGRTNRHENAVSEKNSASVSENVTR